MTVSTVVGRPPSARASGARPLLFTLALALSGYAVVNAASIDLSAQTRVAYLGVVAVLAGITLHVTASRTAVKVPMALGLWSLYVTVQFPLSVVQEPRDLLAATTDLVVTLTPVAFFVAFRGLAPGRDLLATFILFVCLGSAVATLAAWARSGGQRFESPAILLLCLPWVLLISRNTYVPGLASWAQRSLGLALAAVAVGGAIAARSRTSLLVCLLAAALSFVFYRSNTRSAALRILGGVSALAFVAALYGPAIVQSDTAQTFLSRARLSTLATGQADASTQSRLLEARDAVRTLRHDGAAASFLVGLGPGASYTPYDSDIAKNVDQATGRVHNIHITPVLMLFRYGALGVILFGAMVAVAVATAWTTALRQRDPASLAIAISSLCFVVDLLVRNSTADPLFAMTVALAFASYPGTTDAAP